MSEDKAIDHVGPRDAAHDRAYEVAKDLINGRITPPVRRQLRESLDKADKIPDKTTPKVFQR